MIITCIKPCRSSARRRNDLRLRLRIVPGNGCPRACPGMRMEPWPRCSCGSPRWQGWLCWPGPAQSSPDTVPSPGWTGERSRRCAPGLSRAGWGWSPRRCSRICPNRSAATCAIPVSPAGRSRHHPAAPGGPDAARARPAVAARGRRGALLGAPARLGVGRHSARGPAYGGPGPRHVCRGQEGGCWQRWPRCGPWPTPAASRWTRPR